MAHDGTGYDSTPEAPDEGGDDHRDQRRRAFRQKKRRRRAWLSQAERDGRIPAGRGLEHSRRVYPRPAPVRRTTLTGQGLTRTRISRLFRPLTKGVVVAVEQEDMPEEFRVTPEDCDGFHADIITRARAHWLLNMLTVIGYWAALAYHGVPYWCDGAPVVLLTSGSPRGEARSWLARLTPTVPVFRRFRSGTPTVCPDPEFPRMKVVTAPVAAAQCLKSLLRGTFGWTVPGNVPGLTVREVRAVQLLDAVYQCTYLTAAAVREGARRLVDREVLDRLLALADTGAQSPRETLLRLYVRDALPPGFHWTSQVTVRLDPDGRPWKHLIADLACEELKIALFYDGSYHRAEERRSIDFSQVQQLRALGWEAVRVDAALMRDVAEMMEQVTASIARARDGGSGS
ncbi:DUF559 domain-containing protein [Corynebacterium nuruki]